MHPKMPPLEPLPVQDWMSAEATCEIEAANATIIDLNARRAAAPRDSEPTQLLDVYHAIVQALAGVRSGETHSFVQGLRTRHGEIRRFLGDAGVDASKRGPRDARFALVLEECVFRIVSLDRVLEFVHAEAQTLARWGERGVSIDTVDEWQRRKVENLRVSLLLTSHYGETYDRAMQRLTG